MKRKYDFILIFLLFLSTEISAQSTSNFVVAGDQIFILPSSRIDNLPFSNYHFFNPYYYNPAMAGIDDKKRLNADWNWRNNHSFLASYEQPIPSINSAFGMHLSYNSNFYSSTRYYGLAYNYGFDLEEDVKLKIGFQFSQINISFHETTSIFYPKVNKWFNSPSMDLGLAFKAKQFRFGFSVQNLFPSEVVSQNDVVAFFDLYKRGRQFNFTVANTFRLSTKWNWSLAALFRRTKDNNIHDFSSYLSLRKKYFIGATYRTKVDNHWIGFIGLKIKEKVNLQFSFNTNKDDYEDRRFIESLVQYYF